jgi:hypothetical protein
VEPAGHEAHTLSGQVSTRRKRVLTLSPARFGEASRALFELAAQDGPPIVVVIGIATGGVFVVDAMGLPESTRVYTCRLQRPGTAVKESAGCVGPILSRIPRRLADRLRQIEDKRGEGRPLQPVDPPDFLREQVSEIAAELSGMTVGRVLVVDDAVDSGATLRCVLDQLSMALGDDVLIESGVITTTRPSERRLVTPDYSVYEGVLCRFPWSFDFRERS